MAQYLYYQCRSINSIMKTSTKTTVILKAFDMKLKAMLQDDLKNFKAIQNQKNNYSKQAA
ncbi:hypothetical protein GCM10027049_22290 [Mucilaginibacter puniceus]